ncbi:MAG TPA: DNA-processing protein DprA, partial [Clostridiales bacterium]|nr:DNA-processing protein DprA [Clostridiales bacterium]
ELRILPFLTEALIQQLIDVKHKNNVCKHLEAIRKNQIEVITIHDELYPYYLKNIYDPPVVLYCKGKILANENAISLVGSRKATAYGLEAGEELAYQLACLGITVVSGMARGIDSSAHKGALKAQGRTIAVLGCGLDVVYPAENKVLMNNILEKGAVISEYLPGTMPFQRNFPARNRIISGMSLGVVVVEAAADSGSLITANFALEQGREVFALPGNINRINSTGTNMLIKEGAKLVMSVKDILEELSIYNLEGENKIKNPIEQTRYKGLDKEERRIVECLKSESMYVDLLAKKAGYDIKYTNSILTMLELKGIIEQLPGKIYKLKI